MATALAVADGAELTLAGICSACADVLSVAGTAIVLMTAEDGRGAQYVSNPAVGVLEELQFTLGIGPAVDACYWGAPIIEADLAGHPPERWETVVGSALDAGMGAVFSFPLQIGAARLGALTLYRDRPGPLDDDCYSDAVVMAGVVTRAILGIQAGALDGALTGGVSDGEVELAEVHQASGIISVQLAVGVGEALARLRARAFADGTTVGLVATEIVARRLHLSL